MSNKKITQERARCETVTNKNGRIIVIGDLHGCYDDAIALLEKVKRTSNDVVIFAGDLIDRGPDNDKCVDLAMRHKAILGNHEEKHLDYCDIESRLGRLPHNMSPSHVATRMQLKPQHYEYMRSLPHVIRLPEYGAAVVHAGAFPGRSLEDQSTSHLMHIQMIRPRIYDSWGNWRPNEKSMWASRVPAGEEGEWLFWTHHWDGPERLIFGHSVLDRPLVTEKAVGIDGGSVFGLELWAVVLGGSIPWEIVSVKSKVSPHGKADRVKHLIHGDVSTY